MCLETSLKVTDSFFVFVRVAEVIAILVKSLRNEFFQFLLNPAKTRIFICCTGKLRILVSRSMRSHSYLLKYQGSMRRLMSVSLSTKL